LLDPVFVTETPASHKQDPASSFEAEAKITASGKRAIQRQIVLEAVQRFPGRTSAELAVDAGLDRPMVARRLPELRARSQVVMGAVRESRIGGKAVTWWIVA
jgi:hypothetical protein